MIALLMESTRLPPAAAPHRLRGVGEARGAGGGGGEGGDAGGEGRERRRRVRRAVLTVLAVLMALVSMVVIGLGKVGGGERPTQALVGAGVGVPAVEALTESPRLALPGAAAANRFDSGWAVSRADGEAALVALHGTGRLLVVHLGEEAERVLALDLAAPAPEGEAVSVRTGERELARGVVRGTAVRLRLPADLPVGQVPLDVVFGAAARGAAADSGTGAAADGARGDAAALSAGGPRADGAQAKVAALAAGGGVAPGAVATAPALGGAAGRGGVRGAQAAAGAPAGAGGAGGAGGGGGPVVVGGTVEPALAAGWARVEGGDVVQGGNCLVYVDFAVRGNEALVGTFVPPGAARAGQRFDLSVERLDGTPVRRFHWLPSFWNRLRGSRRFELPLRGTKGAVRVRLISHAAAGGDPPGRWQGLGLIDVRGEILTPGQGQ